MAYTINFYLALSLGALAFLLAFLLVYLVFFKEPKENKFDKMKNEKQN